MAYELPPLPYDYTALEPYISKRTLEFHHDKHHAAYVNNFNAAAKGTELDSQPIEAVIKAVAKDPARRPSSTTPRRRGTTPFTGTR